MSAVKRRKLGNALLLIGLGLLGISFLPTVGAASSWLSAIAELIVAATFAANLPKPMPAPQRYGLPAMLVVFAIDNVRRAVGSTGLGGVPVVLAAIAAGASVWALSPMMKLRDR